MPSIVDFLDIRKPVLDEIIDSTSWQLLEDQSWLDPYGPMRSYADSTLLVMDMKSYPTVASIVGIGAELPLHTPKADLKLNEFGSILLGMSYLFTAADYNLREKLRIQILDGGSTQAFEDALFGSVIGVAASLMRLATKLYIDVLQTGATSYVSPLTQTGTSINYAGSIDPTLFPAALASVDRWSQLATANGIANLEALSMAYRAVNKNVRPTTVAIPYDNFIQLATQASTKRAMIGMMSSRGVQATEDVSGIQVTESDMNRLFAARTTPIPPLQIVEGTFKQEQKDHTFINVPYWQANTITFLTTGMGKRAMMPFAENNGMPGIYTNFYRYPMAPFKEIIQGMAATVPFIPDARYLSSQVIN